MYQDPNEPTQQQYPPPPPQGYPQPYPPPPMMPPPPRKRRTGLWITLGIVAFLVVVGALASRGSPTATTPTATQAPANGSAPAPTTVTNTIGHPVVVNADYTVTLNKVSTSTGTEFDMPKAGNIFLVVNVTVLNTSGSTQNASSLVQWSLKDSTGQTYTQDIAFGSGPDGTIAANGKIRGNIAYEVPKAVHSFILQFVAGIGSSDLAEWTVSL